MSFDYSTLVRDRTQADVYARNAKGTYNAEDLNRVTAALDDLYARLTVFGYAMPGFATVLDREWTDEDVPTQSQMSQYIENVRAVRGALDMLPTTPNTPKDMELLTYIEANDIEQILFDVERAILQVVSGFYRNAAFMFYSGNRPMPSADNDLGRTWEDLDAMNTRWVNWQVADWYLLLYGNLKAEGVVA